MPAERITVESLRAAVAELLEEPVESIDPDESLIDLGLDSIRVMSLIESWRHEGIEVGFADLAADPTIGGWHRVLNRG